MTRTMRQIGDIMIPVDDYPSVRDSDTLRQAVSVIESAQLRVETGRSLPRALLVFDDIQVLVGYVRRRDIMRGLEPRFLVTGPLEYRYKLFDIGVDPNLSELPWDRERVVKGILQQADRPVSDVMRPIEAILQADDHVMKAISAMVSLDLSLIPVIEGKELVGVVRSVDAFQEIANILR